MTTQPAARPLRSRRSNLAVPGSSTKMIDKARGLPTDQVFLDLEDAVAPLAKPDARRNIVAALNEGGWGDTDPHRAGQRLDDPVDLSPTWWRSSRVPVRTSTAIMLPKVQTPEQVVALDLLLTQIEKATGWTSARSASRRRSRTRWG